MPLPLWPIFRQPHPNFITVRTAYASEIWAQLTKNLLTKSGTEKFRENITVCFLFVPHLMFLQYCATACIKYNKFALCFQVYFIYFLGFLFFAQFIILHFVHISRHFIILNGSAHMPHYIYATFALCLHNYH